MKTRAEIIEKLIELRRKKRADVPVQYKMACQAQMEILKWVLDEQI